MPPKLEPILVAVCPVNLIPLGYRRNVDPKEILILDGIDQVPELPGFCIRRHDLYDPCPDTIIRDTADRHPVLDRIAVEAATLPAMMRVKPNPYRYQNTAG